MDITPSSTLTKLLNHVVGKSEQLLSILAKAVQKFSNFFSSYESNFSSNKTPKKSRVTSFIMAFVKKLGNPYSILRLSIDKICQYINRFLYILLQEYAPYSTKYSCNFDSQLLKTQNTISPDISFITIRNFSLQKNLSICS